MTRRAFWSLMPGVCLLGRAQEEPPLQSEFLAFDKMSARTSSGGGHSRQIVRGKTATGEGLEVHETTLPAGGAPHPPHHHLHNELFLVRQGTVEVTVNGRSQRLGGGSAAFITSNEEHGIRNVGTTAATYFVVSVGPGAENNR